MYADGNDGINSDTLPLRGNVNNSRSKVFAKPRGSGTRAKLETHAFLEEEPCPLRGGRRRAWTQTHQAGRFCGGEVREFICNDVSLLREGACRSSVEGGCVGGLRKEEMVPSGHFVPWKTLNSIPPQS